MQYSDLWDKVERLSLERATALLEGKTAPTDAEVEAVKGYVETAIEVEVLHLHWAAQSRSRAAAPMKPFSERLASALSKSVAAEGVAGSQNIGQMLAET